MRSQPSSAWITSGRAADRRATGVLVKRPAGLLSATLIVLSLAACSSGDPLGVYISDVAAVTEQMTRFVRRAPAGGCAHPRSGRRSRGGTAYRVRCDLIARTT